MPRIFHRLILSLPRAGPIITVFCFETFLNSKLTILNSIKIITEMANRIQVKAVFKEQTELQHPIFE